MEFCSICDNMLNLSVNEEGDTLMYTCKACKTSQPCGDSFDACIYKANYGGNEKVFYDLFINKYTFEDPTLPRVNNIQCPREECVCHTKKNITPEVIYVRYNDADMKYIYLCCHCKLAWVCPEYQKVKPLFQFDDSDNSMNPVSSMTTLKK